MAARRNSTTRPAHAASGFRLGRIARPVARHPVRSIALALLVLLLAFGGWRSWQGWTAYRGATSELRALEVLSRTDLGSLTEADLASAQSHLAALYGDMLQLDDATALPLGDGVLPHVPWLGPRYRAARQLIIVGERLAGAGASAAGIGRDVLTAFDATGVSNPSPPTATTWLDVLRARQAEIDRIAARFDQAKTLRARIDTNLLPASVGARLDQLDRAFAKVDPDTLVREDLPALIAALGGDGPRRYIVLFPNPAELRPSGGFPGTAALVTLNRGQLSDYTFFDIHDLTAAYMQQRREVVPQPWPIERYFPQDGFLIQDATWWPDFARGGQQFMQMYRETDWPPIDGVVAVEPTLVSDLLRLTGPLVVNVDGEDRTITADNVYDEIERPRLLEREGLASDLPPEAHKEVLALIGEKLIGQLKGANRQTMVEAARAATRDADSRDIQIYASDPAVEAALDRRRWTGRLQPEPSVPTLAVTFGNVVTTKASRWMHPAMSLTVGTPVSGRQQVTLQLDLTNTGSPSADPFYQGFQRWWIEVALPPGSQVVSRSQDSMPDPNAPNGGAYVLDLAPGQSAQLTVVYSIPVANQLLIRRQPGVTPVQLSITLPGCPATSAQPLTADTILNLTDGCR